MSEGMHTLRTSENNIISLEGVVKGLVSENSRVEKIYKNVDFSVGGLPISVEELNSLKEIKKNGIEPEYFMSTPEIAYAQNLKRFGDVEIPPPSYMGFIDHCDTRDIPVHAIDMDDDHYTMAYCKHVSGSNWIMQSFMEKRLLKKPIDADSPVDFALKWDAKINRLSGFQALEENREEVMAKNLERLSRKGNVFSIIEVERLNGIVKKLLSSDCSMLER